MWRDILGIPNMIGGPCGGIYWAYCTEHVGWLLENRDIIPVPFNRALSAISYCIWCTLYSYLHLPPSPLTTHANQTLRFNLFLWTGVTMFHLLNSNLSNFFAFGVANPPPPPCWARGRSGTFFTYKTNSGEEEKVRPYLPSLPPSPPPRQKCCCYCRMHLMQRANQMHQMHIPPYSQPGLFSPISYIYI